MKKYIVLMMVAGLLVGCGSGNENKKENEEMICGGYTAQREISEEEMEMFLEVTGVGDMIFTPLSVATQVVAGLNYRFYCRYEEIKAGASGHCYVVIYKPLDGQPRVTSIDKVE